MRLPHLSNKVRAVFFTLLAGALWGTSFPIIKIGLETIDPLRFVFWRFLVSSVTLVVIMLFFRKFQFRIIDKRLIVFLGIANGVGYLMQFVGMPYTTAAKAALFINLSAMWVAILSPKILGENMSQKKAAGVLMGLLGIVFVSTNLDLSTISQGQLTGDSLLIISGATWALFMVYNKKLVMKSTTVTFQAMTWILIFTFLTILPFSLFSGHSFFALSSWAWASIIYTAIVCWVLPYYLWLEGLKHLSASTSTILLLSEIVVAVVASIIVLQEPITVFSTIGAFFVVIAIMLVSVKDSDLRVKK